MKLVVGKRLYEYGTTGSMGVVTDTCFVNCYWPRVDESTPIFETGSNNIQVMGGTIPINIEFPSDTKFVEYYPDAMYSAFEVVNKTINLTDDEAVVWGIAYADAVASLPSTATKIISPDNAPELEPDLNFVQSAINWIQNLLGFT